MKACNGKFCNGIELALERFSKDKSSNDGHKSICKLCFTHKHVVNYQVGICEKCSKEHNSSFGSGRFCSRVCATNRKLSQIPRKTDKILTKVCSRKSCPHQGQTQQIDQFYFKANGSRRAQCKTCQKADVRKHQLSIDGFISNCFNGARRRAMINGRDFNITKTLLKELWGKQEAKCAVSGMIMTHESNESDFQKNPMNGSIDRIDSSKGYIEGNVQWVTVWIQSVKMDYDEKQVKEWLLITADFLRRM